MHDITVTDVCGGLISEEETIIPIHHWIPRDMTPTEASQLFLASNMTTFDTYANYTVFLCAQTLGVLFGGSSQLPASCVSCHYLSSPGEGESYVQRWQRLFDDVEQWYENRPSQMKPIFVLTAGGRGNGERPFPTVLYGNGAASMLLIQFPIREMVDVSIGRRHGCVY